MNENIQYLNELISLLKKALSQRLSPMMEACLYGMSKYDRKMESQYRDWIAGVGKKPPLDMEDISTKCMVQRIELEQYINEHFVNGDHIYLKDGYDDEITAFIVVPYVSKRKSGWDMVSCDIDALNQEIARVGTIGRDDFIQLCKRKQTKKNRRSQI